MINWSNVNIENRAMAIFTLLGAIPSSIDSSRVFVYLNIGCVDDVFALRVAKNIFLKIYRAGLLRQGDKVLVYVVKTHSIDTIFVNHSTFFDVGLLPEECKELLEKVVTSTAGHKDSTFETCFIIDDAIQLHQRKLDPDYFRMLEVASRLPSSIFKPIKVSLKFQMDTQQLLPNEKS